MFFVIYIKAKWPIILTGPTSGWFENGEDLLHSAVVGGNTDILDLLLSKYPVDSQNEFGETPLHVAARQNRAECVTELINKYVLRIPRLSCNSSIKAVQEKVVVTRNEWQLLSAIPFLSNYSYLDYFNVNVVQNQARNQRGTPGGEEFSESGPKFLNCVQCFQTMSNIFFQGGAKIFLVGAAWLRACAKRMPNINIFDESSPTWNMDVNLHWQKHRTLSRKLLLDTFLFFSSSGRNLPRLTMFKLFSVHQWPPTFV